MDWPSVSNSTNPNGGIEAIVHCDQGEGCLYDIINDPSEHYNLASKMPDKLKEMQKRLSEYQATHFSPDCGQITPLACEAALGKYGGFSGHLLNKQESRFI